MRKTRFVRLSEKEEQQKKTANSEELAESVASQRPEKENCLRKKIVQERRGDPQHQLLLIIQER